MTKAQIDNICLSYRHDFGALNEEHRELVRFKAREWIRAIENNGFKVLQVEY